MENTHLQFENTDSFELIFIKPNQIKHLDWMNPNYTTDIINMDVFNIITCNSTSFIDNIEMILIKPYEFNDNILPSVESQIISEFPNYIYELLYIDNINNKDSNDIASLLNNNGATIYGNAILLKTYLSTTSDSMYIINSDKNDIKNILDSRVNTNIVIFDGSWSNQIVIGDLINFANDFFDDNFVKLEIPFLLHNINIWYETCSGCSTTICGSLINKPIYKCIWFTMITDNYRGSIYLDEVQKIIALSTKLTFPYSPKTEWLEDCNDSYGRKIIKNKYKILELAFIAETLNNTKKYN